MPKIDWTDDAQPTREPRRRSPRGDSAPRPKREPRAEPKRAANASDHEVLGNLPPARTAGRQPLHLIWGVPRPRAEVKGQSGKQPGK